MTHEGVVRGFVSQDSSTPQTSFFQQSVSLSILLPMLTASFAIYPQKNLWIGFHL